MFVPVNTESGSKRTIAVGNIFEMQKIHRLGLSKN